MNIQLKPMKLIFNVDRVQETFHRVVTDMEGNVIWENHMPFLECESIEVLDGWEEQMRMLPVWNIVEHERNIVT